MLRPGTSIMHHKSTHNHTHIHQCEFLDYYPVKFIGCSITQTQSEGKSIKKFIILSKIRKPTFLFSAITPNMKDNTPKVATIRDIRLMVNSGIGLKVRNAIASEITQTNYRTNQETRKSKFNTRTQKLSLLQNHLHPFKENPCQKKVNNESTKQETKKKKTDQKPVSKDLFVYIYFNAWVEEESR